MDRVGKLTIRARFLVSGGRFLDHQQLRSILYADAVALGFAPDKEASARVDEALSKAGTTP